jgi:hypothetical protein
MIWVAYYTLFLFVAVMAWPWTYGVKNRTRLLWLCLGCALLLLPLIVRTKVAFYYGVLGNATIFCWTADTFIGKDDRRARSLVGGAILAFLPVFYGSPVESWRWLKIVLIPSLGYILMAGAMTKLFKKTGGVTGRAGLKIGQSS